MDFHKILVEQMEIAERAPGAQGVDGSKKKLVVMKAMKLIVNTRWGEQVWDKYEPTLSETIDFIIFLSNHKKTLANLNRCCFGFCIN